MIQQPTTDTGAYAVIIETKSQAPILLETEGDNSSLESAQTRLRQQIARPDVIRACVVKLDACTGYWGGNVSLLQAMEALQK